MIDLDQFIGNNTIISYCKASALENMRFHIEAYDKGYLRVPSDYLKGAATVIVIASAVEFEEEKYSRNIFKATYPGYGRAMNMIKRVHAYFQSEGYESKIAPDISQKNAAVNAGLGIYGKSSLIISKYFGTHLRFATSVTNWVPESYPKPLNENYCNECVECILACPYCCIDMYSVNQKKCFNKYVNRNQLSITLDMCSKCQEVCIYNRKLIDGRYVLK